jgi:hypothetical protein
LLKEEEGKKMDKTTPVERSKAVTVVSFAMLTRPFPNIILGVAVLAPPSPHIVLSHRRGSFLFLLSPFV